MKLKIFSTLFSADLERIKKVKKKTIFPYDVIHTPTECTQKEQAMMKMKKSEENVNTAKVSDDHDGNININCQ